MNFSKLLGTCYDQAFPWHWGWHSTVNEMDKYTRSQNLEILFYQILLYLEFYEDGTSNVILGLLLFFHPILCLQDECTLLHVAAVHFFSPLNNIPSITILNAVFLFPVKAHLGFFSPKILLLKTILLQYSHPVSRSTDGSIVLGNSPRSEISGSWG